jgi:V8-like Glu-specific endopeptidase
MISSDNTLITFEVKTARNTLNICAEEKFSDESMLSSCTGFLIAPDLLLTAGHCIKDKTDCFKNMWILDYDKSQSVFSKENIVYCKEIVDSNLASDYSLIRLSKKISDRVPLKIRRTGKLNPEAEFIVIGHPLGFPKISTDQAFLRGNLLNKTFTINSDTYSGNSGSPVIDSKTSLVEGILIKGDKDFEMDYVGLCLRSVHCDENSCKGETVLRSVAIPSSILQ